jgi:hypothetical protein
MEAKSSTVLISLFRQFAIMLRRKAVNQNFANNSECNVLQAGMSCAQHQAVTVSIKDVFQYNFKTFIVHPGALVIVFQQD